MGSIRSFYWWTRSSWNFVMVTNLVTVVQQKAVDNAQHRCWVNIATYDHQAIDRAKDHLGTVLLIKVNWVLTQSLVCLFVVALLRAVADYLEIPNFTATLVDLTLCSFQLQWCEHLYRGSIMPNRFPRNSWSPAGAPTFKRSLVEVCWNLPRS